MRDDALAAGDALVGGFLYAVPVRRGESDWSSCDPVVPPDQVHGGVFRLAFFDFGAVIPASK